MTEQKKSFQKFLVVLYLGAGVLVLPYFLCRYVKAGDVLPLTPPITPTVTPTNTPTPTPQPENHDPVIVTRQLKDGQFRKYYFDYVIATDQDGDPVELRVGNLPKGLKKNCLSHEGWGVCYIFGFPQKVGLRVVVAWATDGRGGEAIKSYPVRIFP